MGPRLYHGRGRGGEGLGWRGDNQCHQHAVVARNTECADPKFPPGMFRPFRHLLLPTRELPVGSGPSCCPAIPRLALLSGEPTPPPCAAHLAPPRCLASPSTATPHLMLDWASCVLSACRPASYHPAVLVCSLYSLCLFCLSCPQFPVCHAQVAQWFPPLFSALPRHQRYSTFRLIAIILPLYPRAQIP